LRIFINDRGDLEAKILRPGTLEMKDIRVTLDASEQYKDISLTLKQKKESVAEDK